MIWDILNEWPLLARLVLAFVVVLVLMAITFWIIRRFGASRLGAPARGRQPRLAVIDAAAVDQRRRLVLIRRDNVEHLLMIGGPTDVVIEQNIVRAVPVVPPREVPVPRPGIDAMMRGLEAGALRPEPAPAESAAPAAQAEPVAREMAPRSERARAPEPPRRSEAAPRPPEPRGERPRPASERAVEVRPGRPAEPTVEVRQSPPTADVNLADMAQRLEAALRRPGSPETRGTEPAARPAAGEPAPRAERPQPPPTPPAVAPGAEPAQAAGKEPGPAAPAATPATAPTTTPAAPPAAEAVRSDRPEPNKAAKAEPKSKSVFDSLEEEMASLLGRPSGKP